MIAYPIDTYTVLVDPERIRTVINKFASDDRQYSISTNFNNFFWVVAFYSQPLSLRTRWLTVAAHLALRTLQAPIVYVQTGPVWAAMWTQFLWLPLVGSMLGGWCAAAAVWRSGAVACAALADSLDERYGARSRRRIEIPNATLQVMVDNLKAEAYQLRMRIVTRAASRGAPVEPAPQDHSHIEEELSEGDIQGSFAHGI